MGQEGSCKVRVKTVLRQSGHFVFVVPWILGILQRLTQTAEAVERGISVLTPFVDASGRLLSSYSCAELRFYCTRRKNPYRLVIFRRSGTLQGFTPHQNRKYVGGLLRTSRGGRTMPVLFELSFSSAVASVWPGLVKPALYGACMDADALEYKLWNYICDV